MKSVNRVGLFILIAALAMLLAPYVCHASDLPQMMPAHTPWRAAEPSPYWFGFWACVGGMLFILSLYTLPETM